MLEETQPKPEEPKEERPLSIVEEAAKIRDEIKQEREALAKERQELQTARAEEMLAGTGGGRVEPEPPKEKTPQEYGREVLGIQNEES